MPSSIAVRIDAAASQRLAEKSRCITWSSCRDSPLRYESIELPIGVVLSSCIHQRELVKETVRLGTRESHALDAVALAFEVLAEAGMLG